jgi:hypothetical protein
MYLLAVKSSLAFLKHLCAACFRVKSRLAGTLAPPSHRTLLALFLILALGAHGQVVINEVGTSNDGSVENGGNFPDWVELYNTGGGTENLLNMSLVFTNFQETNRFFFLANTFLDPQRYLVVWFDSETNSPGIHTRYNLPKNDGGTLLLLRNDGTTANLVSFGLQVTDMTIGRIPDGGGFNLTVPTPALPNQAQALGDQRNLKYNEWMATNSAGVNDDWIELYNPDPLPVGLGALLFTDKTTGLSGEKRIPPLSFIGGLGFIRFWCDGRPKQGADHLDFSLSSSSGEAKVGIYYFNSGTAMFVEIDSISFGPQVRDLAEGRLPDGSTNIVRPFALGKDTPGASNFQPLTNVVINEVLTHTDTPLEDAIELRNPTSAEVDISGWWLSNQKDNPRKFRIPPNTRIGPGGYKVFYEQVNATGGFNTSGTGNDPDFTLNSAKGDELYLFAADATSGVLTGFRRGLDFGAANNGVSFGRYITSTGEADLTAMSARSFGQDNAGSVFIFRQGTGLANPDPVVGPVVITEIMYKPPNVNVTNDNSIDEYIELQNISSTNVPLYITQFSNAPNSSLVLFTNGWKLDDAVKYTFPGQLTLAPNEYLLVVNFDPVTNTTQLASFRSRFSIPPNFTKIFGPYGGKLKNDSASVKLYAPDNVQGVGHPDIGLVPYVLVDKVNYSDNPPWPAQPDGGGASLQRRHRSEYGNDPINWGALAPTPGRTNTFTATVSVDAVNRLASRIDIVFTAQEGQSYTVEYQNNLLPGGPWTTVTNIAATATGPVIAYDDLFSPTGARFYRIKTPGVP